MSDDDNSIFYDCDTGVEEVFEFEYDEPGSQQTTLFESSVDTIGKFLRLGLESIHGYVGTEQSPFTKTSTSDAGITYRSESVSTKGRNQQLSRSIQSSTRSIQSSNYSEKTVYSESASDADDEDEDFVKFHNNRRLQNDQAPPATTALLSSSSSSNYYKHMIQNEITDKMSKMEMMRVSSNRSAMTTSNRSMTRSSSNRSAMTTSNRSMTHSSSNRSAMTTSNRSILIDTDSKDTEIASSLQLASSDSYDETHLQLHRSNSIDQEDIFNLPESDEDPTPLNDFNNSMMLQQEYMARNENSNRSRGAKFKKRKKKKIRFKQGGTPSHDQSRRFDSGSSEDFGVSASFAIRTSEFRKPISSTGKSDHGERMKESAINSSAPGINTTTNVKFGASSSTQPNLQSHVRPPLQRKSHRRYIQRDTNGWNNYHVIRRDIGVDIESCANRVKEFRAQRIMTFKSAMNPKQRKLLTKLRRKAGLSYQGTSKPELKKKDNIIQYRLRSGTVGSYQGELWKMIVGEADSVLDLFQIYLRWTFNTSLLFLILSIVFAFWACVSIFAGLIFAVAHKQPACVLALGKGLDQNEEGVIYFQDAFQLSWTTFSTVGYGLIHPSVRPDETTESYCVGINVLTAFEAFFGVLFAAVCGSVIFGKLARVQSIANVLFSDPCVIQFGRALVPNDERDTIRNRFPCPVLEFRIINRQYKYTGGEIINTSVNVVAITDATESINLDDPNNVVGSMLLPNGLSPGTMIQKINKNITRRMSTTLQALPINFLSEEQQQPYSRKKRQMEQLKTLQEFEEELLRQEESVSGNDSTHFTTPPMIARSISGRPAALLKQQSLKTFVTDGTDADGVDQRRVFSTLELETDSHPYFKRVWTVRHELNEFSPILTNKAKDIIRDNYGYWPKNMCNHKAVRNSVKFHQLIVTLSGTQNASGSSVFGLNVYDYCDLAIGYTFANVLHVKESGRLKIDVELINDVRQQHGGGAEPLTRENSSKQHRYSN